MEIFINSLACISHHSTIDDNFFFEEVDPVPSSNILPVTAPVYKDYIPANTIRRTSHILKMGISAGLMCLRKTGEEKTDAIIVGTAIGCFEDTDKFLRSIVDNDERMLTPTSFIQSTHNTVGGQIALLVKCHGYNFTYVHQNLSFEYALLDGMMQLNEKEAETILVGATDELNPPLIQLLKRAGHIKKAEDVSEPIWNSTTKGYIAGQGAAFFNLTAKKDNSCIAKLTGVKTIQQIKDKEDLLRQTDTFLNEMGLKKSEISLLLSGVSGDVETDKNIIGFNKETGLPIAYFKHLCGEYFTSSGFALWLAASILKKQHVPKSTGVTGDIMELKHVLIVNHYENKQYSLICVSQC
jgi:3-oxoacyl-[acyl-carrier-protein] synthase II